MSDEMTDPSDESYEKLQRLLEHEPEGGAAEARFAEVALEKGYVTRVQIEEALREQQRLRASGVRGRLGLLLVKSGHLTATQFLKVLASPNEGAPAAEDRSRVGKYTLIREIGRGGMATVYEALDPELKRRVALKILREDEVGNAVVRRLHREAAIAAQLQHPNIVAIHEVGLVRDPAGAVTHFISMDLVEGRTLADLIADRKTPREDLLRILEEVSRAAAFAHAKGVVHRDLKPANVLVDKTGRALLTDFGLAHAESFHTQLTRTNAVMGTPQYMAPEQVQGRTGDIGPRTDVYALGVILYEALTGRLPFMSATPAALYQQILNDEPERPTTAGRAVEADLEVLCLKAMEKDAERRYASAGEFADDLARFRRGEPILARRPSLLYRLRRVIGRRRALFGSAAAVLLAAFVVVLVMRRREFDRVRGEARDAYAAGDWSRARVASERGLQMRRDETLETIERESRAKLEAEEAEKQRQISEGEAYRRMQERMKPVEALIRDARTHFYVKDYDIGAMLRRVEEALQSLEDLTRAPVRHGLDEVWALLGMGWYAVGDADRAEEALVKAQECGSVDAMVNFTLAKIYLERSMKSLLAVGPQVRRGRASSKEWSEKALEMLKRPSKGWVGAEEIDRHVALAYRALAENNVDEVIRLCNEGMERFHKAPGTEEYWNLAGWVEGGHDRQKQVDHYTMAIARRPNYAWAYFMRGIARQQREETKLALADYDAAVRLNPRFVEAYNNRGMSRREGGDLKGAIADYDRAIEISPRFVAAWINRGEAKEDLRDFDGAMADFDEAVRVAPDMAAAYNNRSVLWMHHGDYKRAREDVEKAIELDPEYPEAYGNRASMLKRAGDYDGAMADLERVIRINPKLGRAYGERGTVWHAKGELDRALADYEKAIQLGPRLTFAYVNRGVLRHAANDLDGALADYDKALSLDPNQAAAHTGRGNIKLVRGDADGAIAEFDKSIALDPREPEPFASRAMARKSKGDLKGAIADFEAALRLAPADWAYTKMARKMLDESRRALEK